MPEMVYSFIDISSRKLERVRSLFEQVAQSPFPMRSIRDLPNSWVKNESSEVALLVAFMRVL